MFGRNPVDKILQLRDETEIIIALSERISSMIAKAGYQSLTESERLFAVVNDLDTEVNNGGFDQYFFNSSGNHATQALAFLRQLAAQKTAVILEQTMRVFPDGNVPADCFVRQEILLGLDEPSRKRLFELDQAFYANPDQLGALLVNYVREHKRNFSG